MFTKISLLWKARNRRITSVLVLVLLDISCLRRIEFHIDCSKEGKQEKETDRSHSCVPWAIFDSLNDDDL